MRSMPFPMLAWSVALAASAPAAAATHVVTISQMAFGPLPKAVHAGDTIEWRNADVVPHTATAADAGLDARIDPGRSASTVLKKRGTFEVHCSFHPTMSAKLVVE